MTGRQNRVYQCPFFSESAKGAFQRFDYALFKGDVHLPDRDGTGAQVCVGVLYIKIVFESAFSFGVIEHSNAGRATVYPTAKAPVPVFQFQNGGGVGALGVDQDLLIKGALVVVTRGTEKSGPAFMIAGNSQKGVVIEFGNKLILACQLTASFPGGTPCYLSGSYRFFAGGRVFFFGSVRSCSRSSLS